jgi:post-segregation antitoxin (ccd killing protein)
MPIIDLSEKSYCSLVKAARKLGMNIDRLVQQTLEKNVSKIEKESN